MGLNIQDLRNMTKEELGMKINSLREEAYRLNCDVQSGRIEKPHRLKEIRRDIARCKTILREKDVEKA